MGEAAYRQLREQADVIAADQFGDKVLKLANGNYLKLFRVKHLVTSARLFPYWRRFYKNTLRLTKLGIPTLSVIEVLKLPHLDRTAVHYQPLPGNTLREVGPLDAALVAQLGAFIRHCHNNGVFLRSLHLGNVVQTPAGELGLIDVADMRVYPWPLISQQRFRNYYHLCRYEEDRLRILPHLDTFVEQFNVNHQNRLREMFGSPND